MKLIIATLAISNFAFANGVFSPNWTAQDFCNIQADAVDEICEKFTAEIKKRCLINEMEVQDFYLKADFIIDSDQTVFCLNTDYN